MVAAGWVICRSENIPAISLRFSWGSRCASSPDWICNTFNMLWALDMLRIVVQEGIQKPSDASLQRNRTAPQTSELSLSVVRSVALHVLHCKTEPEKKSWGQLLWFGITSTYFFKYTKVKGTTQSNCLLTVSRMQSTFPWFVKSLTTKRLLYMSCKTVKLILAA